MIPFITKIFLKKFTEHVVVGALKRLPGSDFKVEGISISLKESVTSQEIHRWDLSVIMSVCSGAASKLVD